MNELSRALLAAGLCLILGFTAGWGVNGWRLAAKHEGEAQKSARQLADLTAALGAANDKHLAELQRTQNETTRLRNCLRTGSCGLRVAAVCPSSPGPLVDSGARAELTADAESTYFTLRDGLGRTETKLAACQDELRLRTPAVSK